MKYYYKDPLAAAWMSKHFGVLFIVSAYHPDNTKLIRHFSEIIEHHLKDEKIYVHQDSHLTFAPKDRDEGIDASGWQVLFFDRRWLKAGNGQEILPAKGAVCIDKRDGKHFMWPEIEND